MRAINKLSIAIGAALFVASYASDVSAQIAGRDAAIARCIKVAHSQYPGDDSESVLAQRTAVYKACMTNAGQNP